MRVARKHDVAGGSSIVRSAINGVRWRLRATRRVWRRDATHAMPLLETEPVPDGRIDNPEPGKRLQRDGRTIAGWMMFPSSPCVRLEVWLGEDLLGLARLGATRPDLGRRLGPAAGFAGFELTTDLTEWGGRNGETVLRAVGFSENGERHEIAIDVTVADEQEPGKDEPADRPVVVGPAVGKGGLKTLVFTHQLTLGGAQHYLLDLLDELVQRGVVDATVVSSMDGPLREKLAALGIPSHITSFSPAEGPLEHAGRVEELAAWASGRGFEAVFVNTAVETTFPGVEVAELLGIPCIWSIHESFPPSILWGHLHPQVRRGAEEALSDANAVVFAAEATMRIFEPYAPRGHFRTIPYGLDLRPIDEARASFDPAAARRAAGISPDADLIVCIGTVEPRKAQVPLTHAFEMIAGEHPDARLALVGARDDDHARLLGEYIEASPFGERIDLIPITPDVGLWHGMADLLVCASDVESLPFAVLEAMAWETPVLATEIYGLPELIDDGETGWLCAPRDTLALAEGLRRALSTDPRERLEMARRARAVIESRHDLPAYADQIVELLAETTQKMPLEPTRS